MMKKLYKIRLLSLICLVASIILAISSCKKESNGTSGAVELLSFGPSGVKHGDTISFIGNNMDRVTSIKLVGDSLPKSSFLQQTSDHILIIVPEMAFTGFVTLTTPEGNIVSKTILDLKVSVSITSFTPSSRPGDNITITGNYMNWVKNVTFATGHTVNAIDFISASLTQIVVKVPIEAQTGQLILNTEGTKPLIITTVDNLTVILPVITDFSPNPADRGGDITITGTDLDLTYGILFKNATDTIKSFKSISKTQIVVTVPDKASSGPIKLITYSKLPVMSSANLNINGDLPALAALSYTIYDDALENGWQNWGWTATTDFSNTENIREGSATIKIGYDGSWGGIKFANVNLETTGYTEFTFSIYGGPGTGGKVILLAASSGPSIDITVVEGQWTEFKIPLTDMGSPATISSLMFQDKGFAGTIYMDHVGFR